jgi:hypothetical protein
MIVMMCEPVLLLNVYLYVAGHQHLPYPDPSIAKVRPGIRVIESGFYDL